MMGGGSGEALANAGRPFELSRRFAIVGLLSIASLAAIAALLLSRLFADRMLQQEGRLTMQFVQGVIDVESAARYFERGTAPGAGYMEDLLAHIAGAPDILRANVYSRDRRMIWSSDPELAQSTFVNAANEELDAALAGELEIHWEEPEEHEKAEHANLGKGSDFIELYVPIRDPSRRFVVGAIELYRSPELLEKAIDSGIRIIWVSAVVAALLLYVALLPLVRRAQAMIRAQHRRIVEAETQAAIGDLGSAVAHGIRNPLAVIRSSAELVRDGGDGRVVREAASDIMQQVDRLEHWVRELLTYVHLPVGEAEALGVATVAAASLSNFGAELRRHGITSRADFPAGLPRVRADGALLGQVLNSLVANAVEAMPNGGELRIEGARDSPDFVTVRVCDNGVGMTDEQLQRAFRPFHTTKAKGLGVGLPLAKRIVERMGGHIELASRVGDGTTVALSLPVAPA